MGTSYCLHVKQVPFFACTTCSKLTQNANNAPVLAILTVVRRTILSLTHTGHTSWLEIFVSRVSPTSSMEGTVAEGGEAQVTGLSHRPVARTAFESLSANS